MLEVLLHGLYYLAKGRTFPFAQYRSALARISAGDTEITSAEIRAGETLHEVIHPYLGFVRDPFRMPNTSYLGFPEKHDDPFSPKTGNAVVIAFFGGSFADGVSSRKDGRQVLQSTLRAHGIESRILTCAMGGYKQPQQLAALVWLLQHNAPIDIAVNIDGFNEVAIPQAENLPKGVNPFYPRGWYDRTQTLYDRDSLRLIGQASFLDGMRQNLAEIFNGAWPKSITVYLLWRTLDQALEAGIARVNKALLESPAAPDTRYITTGPDARIPDGLLYTRLAAHWKTCSLLMDALCRSRDIIYIHMLQPNQYYEEGRQLTEEERISAYREDHPYRPGVLGGYPLLLEQGRNLVSAGVDFHDLTFVFHDIPEAIYRDDCCHPGKAGYEIVAKYVADAIISRLSPSTSD